METRAAFRNVRNPHDFPFDNLAKSSMQMPTGAQRNFQDPAFRREDPRLNSFLSQKRTPQVFVSPEHKPYNHYTPSQGSTSGDSRNMIEKPTSSLGVAGQRKEPFNQANSAYPYPGTERPGQFGSNAQLDASRNRQSPQGENENSLSWTKYIGMQLKNEDLEKKITAYQDELKYKNLRIVEVEKLLSADKNKLDNCINELKAEYEKKISQLRSSYEGVISKKNQKIKQLVDKVTDETKNCLAQQIKAYLHQILAKNAELSTLVSQELPQKNELARRLTQLEKQQELSQHKVKQLSESVLKLSSQLTLLTKRVTGRSSSNGFDTNVFNQVIDAQNAQISELRSSFQTLQADYLRARASETEMSNKLKNIHNEHYLQNKKQKQEALETITQLGVSLTQRQNQVGMLERKLALVEGKYNCFLDETKRANKMYSEMTLSTKTLSIEDERQIKQTIREIAAKLKDWQPSSKSYEDEVWKLRQRIRLLQN